MTVHQAQNPMTTSGASPMSVHQPQIPMTTSGASQMSAHQTQNSLATPIPHAQDPSLESLGKTMNM